MDKSRFKEISGDNSVKDFNVYKFVVVGAGLAGATVAERIAEVLNKKVLVFEKRRHIGGNCYDCYDEKSGAYIHKYGPHIFHTDNRKVFEYLSTFTDWITYRHKVLASLNGKLIPLPFSLDSIRKVFSAEKANIFERELISYVGYGKRISVLDLMNHTVEVLKELGEFVYTNIFLNYTKKQWGISPEEVDKSVLHRVPVVVANDVGYFSDAYQFLPKDGYTSMIEKQLSHPNIDVLLGKDFNDFCKIDIETGEIFLLGEKFEGIVIYTGEIDALFKYVYGRLPYRSLDLEFEMVNEKYFQSCAVINYPNEFDFTRITEFKHFSNAVNKNTDVTVILREYPKERKPEDVAYYPLFAEASIQQYEKYRILASKFSNLILLGRLAEYRYYDMDDVVVRALDVVKEIS